MLYMNESYEFTAEIIVVFNDYYDNLSSIICVILTETDFISSLLVSKSGCCYFIHNCLTHAICTIFFLTIKCYSPVYH